MKYEVLSIKKQLRYHATVMATPDKWWEKYLLFKRTTTMHFQGTKGLWVDNNYTFATGNMEKLLDAKFDQLFPPMLNYVMEKFLKVVLDAVFGRVARRLDNPPPPFTGSES
jgi:hypothetical protein